MAVITNSFRDIPDSQEDVTDEFRRITIPVYDDAPSNPTPSLLGFAAWSRANENSLTGSLPIFVTNVSNPPVNRPSNAAKRRSGLCHEATSAVLENPP